MPSPIARTPTPFITHIRRHHRPPQVTPLALSLGGQSQGQAVTVRHACRGGGLVGAALYDIKRVGQKTSSTPLDNNVEGLRETIDKTIDGDGKPTEPQLLQVLEPPATAALHLGQVECILIDGRYVPSFFGLIGYRLCGRFAFAVSPENGSGSLLFLGLSDGWSCCYFAEREREREGGAAVGAGKGIGEASK